MPRKANGGPPILRIEALSTGLPIEQSIVRDDFEGTTIEVQARHKPSKGLPQDAQEPRDKANRERAEMQGLVLARYLPQAASDKQKAKLTEMQAKANPPQPKYNQRLITDKNGNTLVLTVLPKANDFKRRI